MAVSTGIPGLKWSLGKKEGVKHVMEVSVENMFSYLISKTKEDTKNLEGVSAFRSS